MLSRILVPTDFSPNADAAWRFAVDLARVHGAATILLHVAPEGVLRDVVNRSPSDDDYLTAVSTDLVRRAELAERAGGKGETAPRAGAAAAGVAAPGRDEGIDPTRG